MEGDDFSPKKPKSSSSSISSISSSTGSQEGKICKVCGDQANSCNFGAITCDPCKAFFRRNGQKIKMLELCDENCVITKDTRASCKSCRLKKCMSVGMDKNLIWTPEERERRKLLVEENRQKRYSSFSESDQVDPAGSVKFEHLHESDGFQGAFINDLKQKIASESARHQLKSTKLPSMAEVMSSTEKTHSNRLSLSETGYEKTSLSETGYEKTKEVVVSSDSSDTISRSSPDSKQLENDTASNALPVQTINNITADEIRSMDNISLETKSLNYPDKDGCIRPFRDISDSSSYESAIGYAPLSYSDIKKVRNNSSSSDLSPPRKRCTMDQSPVINQSPVISPDLSGLPNLNQTAMIIPEGSSDMSSNSYYPVSSKSSHSDSTNVPSFVNENSVSTNLNRPVKQIQDNYLYNPSNDNQNYKQTSSSFNSAQTAQTKCSQKIETQVAFPQDNYKEMSMDVTLNPYSKFLSKDSLFAMDPDLTCILQDIVNAFKLSYDKPIVENIMENPSLPECFNQLEGFIKKSVTFSKQLPWFRVLDSEDQLQLVKHSFLDMTAVHLMKIYNPENMSFFIRHRPVSDPTRETVTETSIITVCSNEIGLKMMSDLTSIWQEYNRVTRRDQVISMCLLTYMLFLSKPNVNYNNSSHINKHFNLILKALENYINVTYTDLLYPDIISIVSKLRQNAQFCQVALDQAPTTFLTPFTLGILDKL